MKSTGALTAAAIVACALASNAAGAALPHVVRMDDNSYPPADLPGMYALSPVVEGTGRNGPKCPKVIEYKSEPEIGGVELPNGFKADRIAISDMVFDGEACEGDDVVMSFLQAKDNNNGDDFVQMIGLPEGTKYSNRKLRPKKRPRNALSGEVCILTHFCLSLSLL